MSLRAKRVVWMAAVVCLSGAYPCLAQDVEFAASIGGTERDTGWGIAVDASGNVHVTGLFSGTVDFDPGPGITILSSPSLTDDGMYVLKLDSEGNFVWARAMTGTGFVISSGLALDQTGNVFTTGTHIGTIDFDPGPGIANLTSYSDGIVFVCKLDSDGNLIWAIAKGGNNSLSPPTSQWIQRVTPLPRGSFSAPRTSTLVPTSSTSSVQTI